MRNSYGKCMQRCIKNSYELVTYHRVEGDFDSMAIKLYGTYYAPNASRAILALHEKEVEFELVYTTTLTGDHKKPEYMALHPFGVIPLLQDGGVQLYESRAIMRYIVDKYEGQGTPKLHGSTLAERAQVEQWLEVENGTFSPILRQLFRQLLLMPGAFNTPPDQAAVEEYTEKLTKVLDIYEAHLAGSGNKYLAGDFVSIADLAHLPFAYPYFNLLQKQELLRDRKHVAEWWAAIASRPAWQKVAALAAPQYTTWLQNALSFPSSS